MTAAPADAMPLAKLKPCPFCGISLIETVGVHVMQRYWRHPHPTDCMVSGMTVTDQWRHKWNRRPPVDEAAAEQRYALRCVVDVLSALSFQVPLSGSQLRALEDARAALTAAATEKQP